MPRKAKRETQEQDDERVPAESISPKYVFQPIHEVMTVASSSAWYIANMPKQPKPILPVSYFFLSTAEPDRLFQQTPPELSAECSFENYVNCCIYYRRKQMLQELEWKRRVFLMLASQAIPAARKLDFEVLQRLVKARPMYRAVQQIKDIRNVLYEQGQELKMLQNDEAKALQNQKIRKAKVNYILSKTAKMCNRIAEEMKELETVDVPYYINTSTSKLRPYQVHGFKFLLACTNVGYNAILADDLGLGKSLQTICLLAALAERGIYGPHLVIVPSTLIYNWQNEFHKWFPAANVLVYYGSKQEREKQRNGWTYDKKFSVLLTSYNTAVTDASILKRRHFYYLIMDEAHIIRNSSTRAWSVLLSFSCENKLLISGTPISNSAGDVWSLLHFVLPGFFASKAEFLELFARDVERMADGELGVSQKLVKSIHQLLRPFMLRRLKSEVENELPKKSEYIVPCPLTRKQLYLYNEFMHAENGKNTRGYLQIVNVLTQLRKICNHPRLLEDGDVTTGFSMGEGIFEMNQQGYYTVLDSYSKTDLELIYKKDKGWWNNFGTFLPAALRQHSFFKCNICSKGVENPMNAQSSRHIVSSTGTPVDLEKFYEELDNNPRKAREFLTAKSGYEFVREETYCSNLLYATERFKSPEYLNFCDECSMQTISGENTVFELPAGNEKILEHYVSFNQLAAVRNVYSFRDERLDAFEDRGSAFTAKTGFALSYIYNEDTISSFTFERFAAECSTFRGYTWEENCRKQPAAELPAHAKSTMYRRSLVSMLEAPFIDSRLIKLLFDPSICYNLSLYTYQMMLEYCDTKTMRNVTRLITWLTVIWAHLPAMEQLERVQFVTDKVVLSSALVYPYEESPISQRYLSNHFLDYFNRESYARVNELREQLTIPYPNRYFYQSENIEYYHMKHNIKLMRSFQPLHSAFYTPERNIGMTRFLKTIWPTFDVFGSEETHHRAITTETDTLENRMAKQICLPHHSEILNIRGLGGDVKMSYDEGKLEVQMDNFPVPIRKSELLKNEKLIDYKYNPGMVLLHLTVPNIGYWSMVNAYIPEQTLFRQPYCVLPIKAGMECCCSPDEGAVGNSFSFNQHTFNFRKLSPTELFSKEQMYRLVETAHRTDLDEVTSNLVGRPGAIRPEDKFEAVNEMLFDMQRRRYIETPSRSDLVQESGKLVVLRELLRKLNDRGCKCLLFTQQTRMLDILEVFLTSLHYKYYRMDGGTPPKQRQQLVDRFNAFPSVFCFIMTTRTGGIGLNLTGANAVIFVDCDWNPQVHQQATDRVHRINETREVEVYTMVSEYTVEENIVRRATQKRHLDKLIMRDGGFVPEFFENEHLFADRMQHRFSQREREIQMVYVSLVDEEQAGRRLGDVLDAFEDEDDEEAKRQLLLEERGDLEDNAQEDSVQVVETGEELMKQVEIYAALQNSPPVFLRFFEEGYQAVLDVVLEPIGAVQLYGFDENTAVSGVSERKKMLYESYEIDRDLFERTVKDLENYAATEMDDDVAKIEVNRARAKVKKIEVQLKAKLVQIGKSAE